MVRFFISNYSYGFRVVVASFLLINFHSVANAQIINGFDVSSTSIPSEQIKSGGPPKDGIPALSNPKFLSTAEVNYLLPQDRVIGVEINGKSRAYPIKILNYHEIVNDNIGGRAIVVSYCPLCGSGLVFSAIINSKQLQFGVSGLLYNSDVLMYDRETNSLWSQLMMEAVTGKLKGSKLEFIESEQTTWQDWSNRYPNTNVMSNVTGHSRNYSRSPYTGYEDVATLYFPVSNRDDIIFSKEKVLGISANGEFRAYPFLELAKTNTAINETLGHISFTIIYDPLNKSAKTENASGAIIATSLYWFAWYAFHPETTVYKHK